MPVPRAFASAQPANRGSRAASCAASRSDSSLAAASAAALAAAAAAAASSAALRPVPSSAARPAASSAPPAGRARRAAVRRGGRVHPHRTRRAVRDGCRRGGRRGPRPGPVLPRSTGLGPDGAVSPARRPLRAPRPRWSPGPPSRRRPRAGRPRPRPPRRACGAACWGGRESRCTSVVSAAWCGTGGQSQTTPSRSLSSYHQYSGSTPFRTGRSPSAWRRGTC